MNDFKEVQYGLELLSDAWRRSPGEAFRNSVDTVFYGVGAEIATLIDSWQPTIRQHTYLTCVSEHDDAEDQLGRLSMWRAYGGDCGVALVLRPEVMSVNSDALVGMFSVPVLYAMQADVDAHLEEVAASILSATKLIREKGRQEFKNWLFHMLRLLILSTKHPGFAEEREWRVTYSPHLGPSPVINGKVHLVRGTPQLVFKIPLLDFPDHDLHGLEVSRLIERVIVGPTQHPVVVADALRHLLKAAGASGAESMVGISAIPLRHL